MQKICNNINFTLNSSANPSLKTEGQTKHNVITKPTTEEIDEETKAHKKAIMIGTTVLALSGIIAILNPKFSTNFKKRLLNLQENTKKKLENNKNNYLSSKFHKAILKSIDWSIKSINFATNANLIKDIGFKWLCTEEKAFLNIRNKKKRKLAKKIDKKFRNLAEKPYNKLTLWFDKISRNTVFFKYKTASKKLDYLESLLKQHRSNLTPEKQKEFDRILANIKTKREVFSKEQVEKRLDNQDNIMCNLERDVMKKWRSYKNGFRNKWIEKDGHIKKNLGYWPEEILMPERNKLREQGLNEVDELFGGNNIKGDYYKLLDIIQPNLSENETKDFPKIIQKISDNLRNCSLAENVGYFDKKRDLILGSAPTDVVSAVAGLGLAGYAIGTADDKDDIISKSLTLGFPAVAGIAANLAFTAMLFSGIQSILWSSATAWGLSKIGSFADHQIFAKKERNLNTKGENKNV